MSLPANGSGTVVLAPRAAGLWASGVPESAPEEGGFAEAAVAAATAAVSDATGIVLQIAVLDRDLGETATAGDAEAAVYAASLSKLVVAVDVVERRRTEGLAVSEADLDLLRRALGPSDDSAMNALWTRFDGAHAASRLSARLGLTATADPVDPSQWGEMRISAADQARLVEHVMAMPEEERDLLVDDLSAAPAVARDGFPQDFGLQAPRVAATAGPVAAKQGWMCCFSQRYYLHSTGVLGEDGRFVVSLLSTAPRSQGWASARSALTGAAEAVAAVLGPAVAVD